MGEKAMPWRSKQLKDSALLGYLAEVGQRIRSFLGISNTASTLRRSQEPTGKWEFKKVYYKVLDTSPSQTNFVVTDHRYAELVPRHYLHAYLKQLSYEGWEVSVGNFYGTSKKRVCVLKRLRTS